MLAQTDSLSSLSQRQSVWVNDVHSQLNPTKVLRMLDISSLAQLQEEIKLCRSRGEVVCLAAGRHAMGAQQFATGAVLFNLNGLNRTLEFDPAKGHLTVESGIQWPQLIKELHDRQAGNADKWTIAQKQTGADRLSLGGAVSANVHGRGLNMAPFVSDIEELTLVNHDGELLRLSRQENAELFNLVVGGYGLFGVIYSLKLRLVKQTCLERLVEMGTIDVLMDRFERLIEDGCIYGDFQFSIDDKSDDFLKSGILSAYKPVPEIVSVLPPKVMSAKKWRALVKLAHTDKSLAFETFSNHYLSTSGQKYLSDEFQLANYLDYYHEEIDELNPGVLKGTEMITELYVPKNRIADFMSKAAEMLRSKHADVIYGTVRLIQADEETFLPWAKQNYACIIFNLHVVHTKQDLENTADILRSLIDLAIERQGSYYLTYHKFANREQVESCYPQFKKFLEMKLKYDPNELFQSDWYRHHKALLC